MKKYGIIIFCVFTYALQAQTKTYDYNYDDNGNRDARNVVYLRTTNGGVTTSADELLTDRQETEDMNGTDVEQWSASEISLFPNPTTRTVNVSFSAGSVQTQEVRIMDGHGKIVYRKEDIAGDFELPFEGLAKGNYFIWLKVEGKIERFQVIKE